ncbi:SMF protein [mine drainage metagenome]|uniref:SMF protein n=1 Tax=mine drainage metagenome TaxID=410659 RepID=T1BJ68_9ZZZZ
MPDLFHATAAAADFTERAIVPARELGAYEAQWARKGVTFKTLANTFREHAGAVPSDFVSQEEAQQYARMALGTIREAGIRHFGIRVNGAGEYPVRLRDAVHPIEFLYYQGNWDITSTPCVAIVGTRHPTDEGARRTAKLARAFVRASFTVVSGLAQGVDTVAHRTVIENGGQTIAVLGTPITTCYPPENATLQKQIADKFLVISQVPIVRYSRQTPRGNRLFFPERNVTMSALTQATVIVEAGNTSGTLIQARHALMQGRKLFILESCFRNKELTWPTNFLDRGAIRVSEFEDIMSHLAS